MISLPIRKSVNGKKLTSITGKVYVTLCKSTKKKYHIECYQIKLYWMLKTNIKMIKNGCEKYFWLF